jgi:hypothetical protein
MQEVVLPERVQEALGQLVGAAKEGLLALSVGVGLGVLTELMEEEVDDVAGPKGKHNPERTAARVNSPPIFFWPDGRSSTSGRHASHAATATATRIRETRYSRRLGHPNSHSKTWMRRTGGARPPRGSRLAFVLARASRLATSWLVVS